MIKNLGWQTVYQVIATCMPLITAPYLSRILGASMIGVFSYTYSLALFFRMFGLLGNINYGTREISRARYNETERTVIFKELLFLQFVATFIALALYYLFCCAFESLNTINIIQSIWIADCFVNITWLYSGLEEFKYTSLRGIAIKLFQLSSILIFVKTDQHVGRYAFIMAISAVLSNLILWVGVKNKVCFKEKIKISNVKRHIKPTLVLFIPVAAASVFQLMDKLMLGKLSTPDQNGYYYNSDHLVNIPILVIVGLCTVMLSRMSLVSSDKRKYDELFDTYSEVILIIAIAMASGIGAIAQEFVPFFFGKGFEPCVRLVYIFVFIMVIKSVSNIIMSMHLIPTSKDSIYVKAVISGAIVNIVFNSLFIGILRMGAVGATLGTLIAELAVMLVEMLLIKDDIKITNITSKVVPYMVIGGIMFFLVRICASYITHYSINIVAILLIEIVVGGSVYTILTLCFLILSKRYKRIKNGLIGGDQAK